MMSQLNLYASMHESLYHALVEQPSLNRFTFEIAFI